MTSVLELRDVPSKGRGLFAARDISSGEAVMIDHPVLLYAYPLSSRAVCAQCLRLLAPQGATTCPSCQSYGFCSAQCAAAAQMDPASHCPLVCRSLAAARFDAFDEDAQNALCYLIHAASLRAAAASDPSAHARFTSLLSLTDGRSSGGAGGVAAQPGQIVQQLHAALGHAMGPALGGEPLSLQKVAELLKKDELNGYGIDLPSADGVQRTRGCAIYAQASLLNHECLPNVARCDAFDTPGPGNTAITFRALHDIPQGSEVTQSYFALNWLYKERQERCQSHYGFACTCVRCKEEATWSDDEEVGSEGSGGMDEEDDTLSVDGEAHAGASGASHDAASGSMQDGVDGGDEEHASAPYITLFVFKHTCPEEQCHGTLVPVQGTDRYQCNKCAFQRTEAQFLAELQGDDE